jgi:cytochrome c oxidase subunit III
VSSHTLEAHDAHDAHAHATHAHQFDNADQQREASTLGMWAFLATEVLFFGGLFGMYAVFRFYYPKMWHLASHELDVWLGLTNTLILLTSSLTMALAVHNAQKGNRGKVTLFLGLTVLCAFGFVGVKSVEYYQKYHHHLIPGSHFQIPQELWDEYNKDIHVSDVNPIQLPPPTSSQPQPQEARGEQAASIEDAGHGETTNSDMGRGRAPLSPTAVMPAGADDVRKLQLFMALYFAMTGLHAFHVVVGIIIILTIMALNFRGWFGESYYTPVEVTGLYWHFVDIVWVFLFPLLYLVDRSQR